MVRRTAYNMHFMYSILVSMHNLLDSAYLFLLHRHMQRRIAHTVRVFGERRTDMEQISNCLLIVRLFFNHALKNIVA